MCDPAGVLPSVHVAAVALTTVTPPHATPPIVTVLDADAVKPEPVSVMAVPAAPDTGDTQESTGVMADARSYVKVAPATTVPIGSGMPTLSTLTVTARASVGPGVGTTGGVRRTSVVGVADSTTAAR